MLLILMLIAIYKRRMYGFCILLFIFCNAVFCQECVTENFENGIASFSSCGESDKMVLEEYATFHMISPHPRSTKYITPQSTNTTVLRCLESRNITITRGGTLEVNRYTTSKNASDVMTVEIVNIQTGTIAATGFFSPSQTHFVPGWETFRMIVPGSGTFVGVIRFTGRDPGAIIFIDSYRFISPTYNQNLCKIYDDTATTTTSSTTTTTSKEPEATTTTQRATESPTTTTSDKSTAATATSTTTINTAATSTTTKTSAATTTTTAAPTSTAAPGTSTQAPRLSISLLNRVKELKVDIKKFK